VEFARLPEFVTLPFASEHKPPLEVILSPMIAALAANAPARRGTYPCERICGKGVIVRSDMSCFLPTEEKS
jgi:hypothetical protein